MNKKLKIVLILVSAFILFLGILLAIPPIENYISEQSTLKYKEYEKKGDDFVYEFQYAETYSYLEEIIADYNKEFGYDTANTDNKILMGKDKKETVFAEYNENNITIYCEDIVNGKLTDSEIEEYLEYLLYSALDYDYDSTYEIRMEYFNNDLRDYHDGMSKLMMDILFISHTGYIPPAFRLFMDIVSITNIALGLVAVCYFLYNYIYFIYCLIYFLIKKKKKEVLHIKRRVILSLLSALYLLVGGLDGIITFILSFSN